MHYIAIQHNIVNIKHIKLHAVLGSEHDGWRCDRAAADLFSEFSRARLRTWIEDGSLRADGELCKPRQLLLAGTELSLCAEQLPSVHDEHGWHGKDMDLDVIHEDESILVINKRAGMVVHPAVAHRDDTMVNALLFRYPELKNIKRAGIVHRLDKDTSGLLVVARTLTAYQHLVSVLQRGEVHREYRALTLGILLSHGQINKPIGRNPTHRMRMAVVENAKQASTHYRVLRKYRMHSYIALELDTGRTHQIRVHMAHLGHPLVGDTRYGARLQLPSGAHKELVTCLSAFKRQALHAVQLGFVHPTEQIYRKWTSPLPEDMLRLTNALEHDVMASDR